MSTESAGAGPLEHLLHEIRTPLSVISGNVYIVHKHWDRLDSPKRQSLLESALQHTETLNQTLLSLNHVEAIRSRRGRLTAVSNPESADIGMEIRLEFGNEIRTGRAPISGELVEERAAVVRATLDALQGLLPFAVRLQDVTVAEVGTNRLALVSLDRGMDALVGSAIVRDGADDDAFARATLDALNRFLLDPALT